MAGIRAAAPPIEREFGHAPGITAPAAGNFFVETLFSVKPQNAGMNLLIGPNAQAAMDGPMPLATNAIINALNL